MGEIGRIGVLTGGGDCPGLNAVIRAVVKDALRDGIDVIGIEDGFLGLIENRVRPLADEDVSNILHTGGTILGSNNRANPCRFATGRHPDGTTKFEDVTDLCMRHVRDHGLDALVVIGGDGTMACAAPFVERGVPCVGVPKTIDNDLWGTEITFGFQTAVQTATEAMDRVRTTAASHHRVMVVEVMGRNAGWIALHAGIASGADVILVPEMPFDLDAVARGIVERRQRGKRFSIVCCAEGAKPLGGERMVERVDPTSPDPIRLGGIGRWLAGEVENRTGIESRYVVLGHVQRGGTPVAADRVLATQFGDRALDLLQAGRVNRLIVMQGGRLGDVDLLESAGRQRLIGPDEPLLASARAVGTGFGQRE